MTPLGTRLQLLDAGWSPIPVQGKAAVAEGWTRYCAEPPTEAEIETWGWEFSYAESTGLACGHVIGIDIDVASDEMLARRVEAEAVEHFGFTPFRRVGRAPKVLLVYRAAEPITTRRLPAAVGNGDRLEVLSSGTQFVASGIHPDTGKPYEWTGDLSPLEAGPEHAPAITEAQIDAFLDAVHRLMPLATTTGKAGRARGGGMAQTVVRDSNGMAIDGREWVLAQCVWKAAARLVESGTPLPMLQAQAVAALAWELFTAEAYPVLPAKRAWTLKDALQKARATVRRLKDGTKQLRQPLPSVEPTYAIDGTMPVERARERTAAAIKAFLEASDPARVHAIKVSTGVGKTRIAARLLADHRKSAPRDYPTVCQPWLYAVPTHRLGEDVAEQFSRHGLRARVFRGREADNPDIPGEKMCSDIEAVRATLAVGENVQTACCKAEDKDGNELKCLLFDACAYQQQKNGRVDVWIVAHDMLFHAQAAFGDIGGVIIDEGFWDTAIPDKASAITLDELRQTVHRPGREADDEDINALRSMLAQAVALHEPGGLRREHLRAVGLMAAMCTAAHKAEWQLKPAARMWPGMAKEARQEAMKAAGGIRYVRTRAAIWKGAQELLEGHGEASGRIYLTHDDQPGNGRVTRIHARLLKTIAAKCAGVPTFIMDATLPDLDLIRPLYPHVALTEAAEASMPHARIRYVIGAPTAAAKLASPEASERNVRDIRRYILALWLEHDRKPGLVICQKGAEDKLKALGLPKGIAVEHFNAIAGLDHYKNVRWCVVIGRTVPRPHEVEVLSGVVGGVECEKAGGNGAPWYEAEERGIRLKGKPDGVAVRGDKHPDPLAETIRWQICEGELMQALGRVRGVNRTIANPVAIDILADVALPIEADEVVRWEVPSRAVETLAVGVLLESPADMTRLFPGVWPNLDAAKREAISGAQSYIDTLIKNFAPEIGRRLVRCRYRPTGRGQSWRTAHFDIAAIPEPKAWFEKRLGPLGGFEMDAPAAAPVHEAEPVTEADRPEPQQPKPPLCRTDPIRQDAPDGITALLAEMHTLSNGATVQGRVAVSSWMARKPAPLAASEPKQRRDLDEHGGLVMRCGWTLPDGSFLAVSGPTNTSTDGLPDVLTIRQGPAGVLRADGAVVGGRASL